MENPLKKIATEAASTINSTMYKTVKVGGLNSFHRHTARKNAQTIFLFLRGRPTSSQMIRCLITQLSDKFQLLALDYPGFGNSNQPSMEDFNDTFVRISEQCSTIYPSSQEYFRKHQPPTFIVWGKNDYIFPEEGVHPYK